MRFAKSFLFVVSFFVFSVSHLSAQSQQDGSVAIASATEPIVNDTLAAFAKCVATLADTKVPVPIDKAVEACKDVAKRATRAFEGAANSAQKAAQAARPVVVATGYTTSGGYYYTTR